MWRQASFSSEADYWVDAMATGGDKRKCMEIYERQVKFRRLAEECSFWTWVLVPSMRYQAVDTQADRS